MAIMKSGAVSYLLDLLPYYNCYPLLYTLAATAASV